MAIDITGADMRELIKKAYDMSIPVGLGYMHYTPDPLTEEEVDMILDSEETPVGDVFSMDYIKGRAVKLSAWEKGGRIVTGDVWHDHTDDQYAELLWHVGIKYENRKAHGIACHCDVCQTERR